VSLPSQAGCYHVYAEAGRHWWAGEDLYSHGPGLDVFRYSPLAAVFLVPFSALPAALGSPLLRAANLAVYLGALAWWARAALPAHLSAAQRGALALLVVPLSLSSLVDVQTNALAVGLLLLAITAAVRRRWNLAAATLVLSCGLKAYPLALALLLAAVYPRRFAGRFLAALAVGLALPFLFQHPGYVAHQYGEWVRWGLNDRQAAGLGLAFRDVRLLCRVWLVPLSPSAFRALQVAAGAAVAALVLWQRRRGVGRRRLLATLFALACGWMMVFGPATEATTYIFLAPSLGWAVVDGWHEPPGRGTRAALVVSFGLFTATQLALWFPHGSDFQQLAPHPIAGLLLMGAITASALRAALPLRPADEAPRSLPFPLGVAVGGETSAKARKAA
jgi:hypothetical protein